MTTNRAPRRSALSGASAVRPAQPEQQPRSAEPEAAPQRPAPSRQTAPTATKQQKVGFYQHPEDAARMRGAFRKTNGEEGDRSLSDFIQKAIMAEVERREKLYNSGQPFEAVQPGEGPIGRPEGS
ncbi:MAG: hypothetical protein L0G69_01445 [Brevibacterium sp.]|nr:hypothetical protein [Brevibacterium sp.]